MSQLEACCGPRGGAGEQTAGHQPTPVTELITTAPSTVSGLSLQLWSGLIQVEVKRFILSRPEETTDAAAVAADPPSRRHCRPKSGLVM